MPKPRKSSKSRGAGGPAQFGGKHQPGSGHMVLCEAGQWWEGPLTSDATVVTGEQDFVLIQAARARAEAALSLEVQSVEEALADGRTRDVPAALGDVDGKWLATVQRTGTLSDKVAAWSLVVTASPLHGLSKLDAMLELAKRPSRREAGSALDAMQELWLSALLPSTRKLLRFDQRPIQATTPLPQLVAWAWEDALKAKYAAFVSMLEKRAATDGVTHFRTMSLRIAAALLSDAPEAEERLLAMLVGKLGDGERKVASKAAWLLQQVVDKHSAMKAVVVDAITKFVKGGASPRACYYAMVWCSQLPIPRGWTDLAKALIGLYLHVFERAVAATDAEAKAAAQDGTRKKRRHRGAAGKASAKKAAVAAIQAGTAALQSKLLSVVLSGLNRALPYAADTAGLEPHIDLLFRAVHVSTPAARVQALSLLWALSGTAQTGAALQHQDRFYRALYASLQDTSLRDASRQHHIWLNLLWRAVKADTNDARVRAMVKRVLQLAAHAAPALACALLYMVSHVLAQRPKARMGVTMADSSVALSYGSARTQQLQQQPVDESEGSEHEESARRYDAAMAAVAGAAATAAGTGGIAAPAATASTPAAGYDPLARDPRYAHAERAAYWELTVLAQHVHPSVRKWAEQILRSPAKPIQYGSDPLADFSIMSFLDRFVYRNPKAKAQLAAGKTSMSESALEYAKMDGQEGVLEAATKGKLHGTSVMQRRGAAAARTGRTAFEAPVNTKEFQSLPLHKVREEDKFFHAYFTSKAAREAAHADGQDAPDQGSDLDSDSEVEEFAAALAEDLMRQHAASQGAGDDDLVDAAQFDYSDSDSDEEDMAGALQPHTAVLGGGDDSDEIDSDAAAEAFGFEAHSLSDSDEVEDASDGEQGEEKHAGPAQRAAADSDEHSDAESEDEEEDFMRLMAAGGDEEDGEDRFNFSASDDSEEEQTKPVPRKRGGKARAAKGMPSVFASADDYAHLFAREAASAPAAPATGQKRGRKPAASKPTAAPAPSKKQAGKKRGRR